MPYGKYKGVVIKSMRSQPEIDYLKWLLTTDVKGSVRDTIEAHLKTLNVIDPTITLDSIRKKMDESIANTKPEPIRNLPFRLYLTYHSEFLREYITSPERYQIIGELEAQVEKGNNDEVIAVGIDGRETLWLFERTKIEHHKDYILLWYKFQTTAS